MSTLNPSRREVIAALSITSLGTGAILAAASNAMANPERVLWDKRLAAYRAAYAAMEAEDDDSRWEVLCDKQTDAMMDLLATPAPDGEALAEKLRIYNEREVYCLTGKADIAQTRLIADAIALGKAA